MTGKVNATATSFTTNHLIASLFGNDVACWAPFHWAAVFFFPQLVFFSLLNAPAPWRNSCPYIPSTAKSHWSQCEQTIVKRWNKNEEEKKRACSLSGHSRDRRRRTELWPGTPSLPPKFWFIWLTLCEKHLQLHIKNTRPFCSSTFRLHYYSAEPSPRPCGVRRKGYFARPICSVLNRIIM